MMKVKISHLFLLLMSTVIAVSAQDVLKTTETQLKDSFEDKTIRIKVDLPADRSGIDINMEKQGVIEAPSNSKTKQSVISLAASCTLVITKIAIVGNRIEVQLGGGGYDARYEKKKKPVNEESPEEKSWREKYDNETKSKAKRSIYKANWDDAKKRRIAKYNKDIKDYYSLINQKRLNGGSRFNLHFAKLPDTITADDIMQWLAAYVDFSPILNGGLPVPCRAGGKTAPDMVITGREYWGDWRNGKGEILHIEEENLRFAHGAAVGYKENFRLAAEHFFVIETAEDRTSADRFILLKVKNLKGKNRVMTLLYFNTLDELKDGKNKNREETRSWVPG